MLRGTRTLTLAVLATAVLFSIQGKALGQFPPASAPALAPPPPANLPVVDAPGPMVSPPTPALHPGEKSVHDIVTEATEGPTASNPTGRQEPGISLEWLHPAVVRLGKPATCTLVVKSLSANRLHRVVLRTRIGPGVTIRATEPKAEAEADLLLWQLGNLEPRQEKRIDLHLVPATRGSLPCHAFVTFTGSSTARLEVREPRLAVEVTTPKKAVTGDVAMVVLKVSNPGDARTDNIKVRVQLSEGLQYGNGKGTDVSLDSLGPNESRTVLLHCEARTAGVQTCSAAATADGDLQAQGSGSIEVLAPRLELAVAGPTMRYLDRPAVFSFTVTNPGNASANNVTVRDVVPAGFKVVAASDGAHHDFVTRTVVWFLGELGAGQSKEVKLELVAINPGEFRNQATATAARGLKAATEALTRIEGLPGLLMELVDIQDPVEMGKDASYEIRVSNTGTKTETNLQLTCTLSESMAFRGARSTTDATFKQEGREVVFAVVPRLAPRADVIYRVNVRCLAPGDLRFQARVRADGLETPVLREESTRVFGDESTTAPAR